VPTARHPESDALVDALAQTAFATMAVLTRLSAEHDLSLTQLRVLAILRDRRVRMSTLANHLGLERSTLSGLVDRAERRNLLLRVPNRSDGRAVDVLLTAEGAQLARRLTAEVRRSLAPMTGALTPVEERRLTTLLQRAVGLPHP
jgi:DNA-binding MarR family transcriptional regulator